MSVNRFLLLPLALVTLLLLAAPGRRAQAQAGGLSVELTRADAALTAGEWVSFESVIRNNGDAATPPLVAHLSIAALEPGRHVDPEDWSPERTQFRAPLQPGETVTLAWRVHALFEGGFATFVTIMAADEHGPLTAGPVFLQVAPDNILPLSAVAPVVAVVPLLPLAVLIASRWHVRRRSRVTAV